MNTQPTITDPSVAASRPQLQLAIDAPEHLALIPRLRRWFDIIEVGTPVLKRFGLSAITTARELGRGIPVLADTKTVDGGALEAEMVGASGASMMTVVAHAAPATRRVTREVAARYGVTVVYDTILDGEFPAESLRDDRDGGGPDSGGPGAGEEIWLALHNASDARLAGQGDDAHIERVGARRRAGFRVSLAGGIGRDNLSRVLTNPPEVIVIGSSVTGASRPEEEAEWIAAQIATERG
ncbi:orotidine 5'-phosphate decarboxylase [Leucobacter sp. CSA1]|uniref:Orotidine 5'-phosphate decarboxylase n=1 Tax=Leucobacter chromiisoli TaxID=2796471 RepID=A0A934Q923_9MICO|nr:orotidine 5'-phosphate decarboxylase / HUMPS family protein [Leucobacter chromiisoli]MBK0419052.1 orotidine 5'-phosphate decarboxylase [Leucobacter chromiisoli]